MDVVADVYRVLRVFGMFPQEDEWVRDLADELVAVFRFHMPDADSGRVVLPLYYNIETGTQASQEEFFRQYRDA